MAAALPESQHPAKTMDDSSVRNLVVPLDGSGNSRVAIPVARGLAELYGAIPHLVCVGEQRSDPEAKLAQFGVQWEELPGAVIDQVSGTAPDAILRLAKSLDEPLIIMCTHTGHIRNPDRFGSVTEAVLAGNPDRVVLVMPERGHTIFKVSRILIAHDGTPGADCAIAPAAELALRARAEVIAVYVAAPRAGAPQQSGSLPGPQYIDQPQHEWPSWAAEFGERMLAVGAPASALKFKLIVRGGQAGSEISLLARTQKVDMIVMGNPGSWKRSKRNLTRAVIQNSGCPVLLIRPEASAHGAPAR